MAKRRDRNAGTWTEARYWQQVRSSLRNGFRYWKPIMECKLSSRRKYVGSNRRQKWEYECAACGGWFMGKEIQVDHVVAVGSLKCSDDLVRFLEALTVEDGFQVLCKECHKEKTNRERNYA